MTKIFDFFSGIGIGIFSHMFGGKISGDDFDYLINLQLFKSPDDYLKIESQDSVSQLNEFLKGGGGEKLEGLAQKKDEIKSVFQRLDLSTYFEKYFSLLWYSSLPCFDVQNYTSQKSGDTALLKMCVWKGVRIPCSAIFKKVPTDSGMCCAFNKEKAEKIFVESKYTR